MVDVLTNGFSRILVGVDLDVQRQALDTLLRAEIRWQALHRQADFSLALQRIPVNRQRIVADLFDVANESGRILGVRIQDSLFDGMLAGVPKVPRLHLFFRRFSVTENDHNDGFHRAWLEWRHFRIDAVFQRDWVKLALVHVGDPVIFPAK